MKHLPIFSLAAGLLIFSASCGSGISKERQKEIADSIEQARQDSVQAVEAAKIAEAARLDSLRQDSIDRVQKVIAAMPKGSMFFANGDIKSGRCH